MADAAADIYDIIRGGSAQELIDAINVKLAEGWDLIGGPNSVETGSLVQAIIKRAKMEPAPSKAKKKK